MFNIPQNSHYVHRYISFIESIKLKGERNLEFKESHHIIPRCFGGSNAKSNLINLTFKEHLIAHLILSKCFYGKHRAKMIYAFYFMLEGNLKSRRSNLEKMNSYLYKKRELFTKYVNGNHPNKGNRHTEESKQKMSAFRKLQVGWTHTKETKEKMSISAKKRIRRAFSEEAKQNMSKAKIGITFSKERNQSISDRLKGRPEVLCTKCNKMVYQPSSTRWHFDNCKNV